MTGSSNDAAILARQQETEREGRVAAGINAINKAFKGFDDSFYKQRAKAYTDYAMPQYGQQYNDTRNRMLYNLANRGLGGSGVAQQQANALALNQNQNLQTIGNEGIRQAQQLRSGVEQGRSNLIAQAQAGADPYTTGNQALTYAQGFSAPSIFAPLGNMFSNFANQYLANQYSNAATAMQAQPFYNYWQRPGMGGTGFIPSNQ